MSIWRDPGEETIGLYPGLVVCDGRVSGSITVGQSRLPLWCFMPYALSLGFDHAAEDYYSEGYEDIFGNAEASAFLYNLLELRGEFGRLLLVLADAERCESRTLTGPAWWRTKRHRKRVGDQLRRCLATLEDQA